MTMKIVADISIVLLFVIIRSAVKRLCRNYLKKGKNET